jgi:YggT family protein
MAYLKYFINIVALLLTVLIFLDSLLSYFMREDSIVRRFLGKILSPIYQPIRRLIPPLAGIDFTPLISIILVQVVTYLIITLLSLFGSTI